MQFFATLAINQTWTLKAKLGLNNILRVGGRLCNLDSAITPQDLFRSTSSFLLYATCLTICIYECLLCTEKVVK